MNCWEILNADLSNWVPGTRFFATDHGTYFVVDADLAPAPGFVSYIVRRPTAVFFCTETAGITDLDPDATFPPMTTAEQAVQLMGYTLIPEPEGEGS